MKIAIFGNKKTTRTLIDYLLLKKIKIHTLISLSSKKLNSHEISGVDENLNSFSNTLNIYNPSSYAMNSDEDFAFFKKNKFDIGICTGWQRLIKADILNSFSLGIFGWHGSMFEFPNGRGRSPLNWSIRLGGGKVYHNLFKYDVGADDGAVFDTKILSIRDSDYIEDLQKKAIKHICESAHALILKSKRGEIDLKNQPQSSFILFPSLSEKDGQLFPKYMSGLSARNIVRSCSKPFPGSYICINKKPMIRIWNLEKNFSESSIQLNPGKFRFHRDQLFIGFNDVTMSSSNYEILNKEVINLREFD